MGGERVISLVVRPIVAILVEVVRELREGA